MDVRRGDVASPELDTVAAVVVVALLVLRSLFARAFALSTDSLAALAAVVDTGSFGPEMMR